MFCRKRRLKRVSDGIFKNALHHGISSSVADGITDIQSDKNTVCLELKRQVVTCNRVPCDSSVLSNVSDSISVYIFRV